MLLAAAAVVAVALVASAWFLSSTETLLKGLSRRKVLVACKDGQTFSGVLWEADRGCLLLKAAAVIGDDGAAAVDGEVLILRPDVAFIQAP